MNLAEISRQYTDLKEKVFKEPLSRTSTPSQDEHEAMDIITIESPTLDSQEIMLLAEDEVDKNNFVHEPILTDNDGNAENGQLGRNPGMLFFNCEKSEEYRIDRGVGLWRLDSIVMICPVIVM